MRASADPSELSVKDLRISAGGAASAVAAAAAPAPSSPDAAPLPSGCPFAHGRAKLTLSHGSYTDSASTKWCVGWSLSDGVWCTPQQVWFVGYLGRQWGVRVLSACVCACVGR